MFVSENVHGEACVVRGDYYVNSDHWTIDCSLRLERMELWGTINHDEFSQRSCGPKTDEAKQIFKRGVAKDLCWMDEEARGEALVSVEESFTFMLLGLTLTLCHTTVELSSKTQEKVCRSQDDIETIRCT